MVPVTQRFVYHGTSFVSTLPSSHCVRMTSGLSAIWDFVGRAE
jgi:hypothetical protein